MEDDRNTTIPPEIFNNNSTEYQDSQKKDFIMHVATCIIISIGLPLTLVTIYALYSLVRKDHVAPIYVINLLITDLLQLCCMIVFEAKETFTSFLFIADYMYDCLLLTSIGFMVCVSLERYLVIAHPLWYRFRRNIKITVAVCVIVWIICPVFCITVRSLISETIAMTLFSVFLIIPFPLFIFFLVGTLRALSTSVSVSNEERQRIVAIVVLVLFIYMFLFLPSIVRLLEKGAFFDENICALSFMFVRLSPLADLVLYIFIRKDTIGKILTAVCCCRMESNSSIISTSNDNI